MNMYNKFEILQKKNLAGARECDGGMSRPVTQLQTRASVSKSCRAPSKGNTNRLHHKLFFILWALCVALDNGSSPDTSELCCQKGKILPCSSDSDTDELQTFPV